jgi:hypothetical protein
MKNMSIVGEDYHTDEHVVGYQQPRRVPPGSRPVRAKGRP